MTSEQIKDLDELTDRLLWFVSVDDEAKDDNHLWVFAEWIAGMTYGYRTSRLDNWELRFVCPLVDLADLGDALS